MRIHHFLSTLLLFVGSFLPLVLAGGDDKKEDDDGFFYFQDDNDWSDAAIYPQACIETNQGDYVVYSLYKSGHNQCKKRSLGTYKLDIGSFVRAYTRQMQNEYEAKGQDYEVDEESMNYLQCQQYYYNNNLYYMKVGCRNTGKGFQLHAYSDAYCTEKASMNYNFGGIDISGLRVSFQMCKSCVASSNYGYNNNYNNNNKNNGGGNAYYYQDLSSHDSMLCSAANHYKENCNGSCRRQARRSGSSSGSRGYSGEGFSPVGKFFLWVLSISAVFFLLAGLAQRKKMSKQDALIEEAAIKSSGVDKKYIPRIFIGLILFIILLILFKKKTLTWFFLIAINIALLAYWMHLKNKAEQNAAVSGFQLYGEGGSTA